MAGPLNSDTLDTLFFKARTHNAWQAREVSDELLMQLYEMLRMGPTAMNALPGRFYFIKSPEANKSVATS
ncbi:MAG: hypothetical protein AB2814_04665 [Candidatus Sedimenticola endophacoides]